MLAQFLMTVHNHGLFNLNNSSLFNPLTTKNNALIVLEKILNFLEE